MAVRVEECLDVVRVRGLRHHGVNGIEGVDWGPRGDEDESGDGDGEAGDHGSGTRHVS